MGPEEVGRGGTRAARRVVLESYWVCERIGSKNTSKKSNAPLDPVRIQREGAVSTIAHRLPLRRSTFLNAIAPHSGPFAGDRAALRAHPDLVWDKGEGRGHSSGFRRPLGASERLWKPKFDANPSQS